LEFKIKKRIITTINYLKQQKKEKRKKKLRALFNSTTLEFKETEVLTSFFSCCPPSYNADSKFQ